MYIYIYKRTFQFTGAPEPLHVCFDVFGRKSPEVAGAQLQLFGAATEAQKGVPWAVLWDESRPAPEEITKQRSEEVNMYVYIYVYTHRCTVCTCIHAYICA